MTGQTSTERRGRSPWVGSGVLLTRNPPHPRQTGSAPYKVCISVSPGNPLNAARIWRPASNAESGLVGTQTLANPDLVDRTKTGAPLSEVDRITFYGGDERGYIDYPTLERVYSPARPS